MEHRTCTSVDFIRKDRHYFVGQRKGVFRMQKLWLFCVVVWSSIYAQVYDCFPFFNELEVLDIRLHELNDVVDYFVLVESTKTFQGNDKPLYFEENKDRFAPFLDKIIHVVVDDMPEGESGQDNWQREYYQCEQMKRALRSCKADDVILWGDVDEIPKKEFVATYAPLVASDLGKIYFSCQKYYGYYLNLAYWEPDWLGTGISSYYFVKDVSRHDYREKWRYSAQSIYDSGWHFSWQGGIARVIEKIESFCHPEQNKNALDIFEMLQKQIHTSLVEIDERFPQFVQERIEYFEKIHYIAHDDPSWCLMEYQRYLHQSNE